MLFTSQVFQPCASFCCRARYCPSASEGLSPIDSAAGCAGACAAPRAKRETARVVRKRRAALVGLPDIDLIESPFSLSAHVFAVWEKTFRLHSRIVHRSRRRKACPFPSFSQWARCPSRRVPFSSKSLFLRFVLCLPHNLAEVHQSRTVVSARSGTLT